MIGIYDYTVILTYISAISACVGIFTALDGTRNPVVPLLFLMFSGLCDTFDGTVAKTKKNRTELHKMFGIQIDSLSDLVAFGMLPSAIGYSVLKRSDFSTKIGILYYVIILIYILAALVRLAYYNVTEIEIQKSSNTSREYYDGLPVSIAALIFPMIFLVQSMTRLDLTAVYFVVMLFMAVAFSSRIKIKKPRLREMIILALIGAIEFVLILIYA